MKHDAATWRELAYWYDLEARLKRRFDEITKRPFPAMPHVGGEMWLLRQVTLALAPAFLLVPIVTWALYPWLPQPDWWIYESAGVALLTVAFVAHTEYKKAQHAATVVSEHPLERNEAR